MDLEGISLQVKHETLTVDCKTCVNKGRTNGLSQESFCDGCIHQETWRKDYYVAKGSEKVSVNIFTMPNGEFGFGDTVKKKSGSEWEGKIVGFYKTKLTPIGYAVESSSHGGSVQIYPESALVVIKKNA